MSKDGKRRTGGGLALAPWVWKQLDTLFGVGGLVLEFGVPEALAITGLVIALGPETLALVRKIPLSKRVARRRKVRPVATLPFGEVWIDIPQAMREAKAVGVGDISELAVLTEKFQQAFPDAVRGTRAHPEVNEEMWIRWVTEYQGSRRGTLEHLPDAEA